jgi:hypothetical protein
MPNVSTKPSNRPLTGLTRRQLVRKVSAIADAGDVCSLVGLFETFQHAAEALGAVVSQPRIGDNEDAEAIICTERERLTDMAEETITALRKLHCDPKDYRFSIRRNALVSWDLYYDADPKQIMATLAEAV